MNKKELVTAIDDNILKIISHYIPLKPDGYRYVGYCPFCRYERPVFFVHPDSGEYRCCGCESVGSAIRFLTKKENVTFSEAIDIGANILGISVLNDVNQHTCLNFKIMNYEYVFEKGKINSTLDEIESLVKRLRVVWKGVPVQGKELQDYLEHFKSNERSPQAYERKYEAMKDKEFVLVDWVEHIGCFELLKNKLEALSRLCH